MRRALVLGVLLLLSLCQSALAVQTVRLPATACAGFDSIFADSFDGVVAVPGDPSLGRGGNYPGNQSRSFQAGVLGQQTYYLYIPEQYQTARAMPLMVVLEGAAGSHAGAIQQARDLRDDWSAAAETFGFIIAIPVSNGSGGGWLAPDGFGTSNDYDVIAAALTNVEQAYNIERNRVSAWGFSAGAFIAWDMLLNNGRYVRPTPLNAGNLASLASAAGNSRYACQNSPGYCAARFSALPRQVPLDMHIGLSDANYSWAQADYQRLLGNGWIEGDTLSYTEFNGGHTYALPQLDQVAGFACGFAIQP